MRESSATIASGSDRHLVLLVLPGEAAGTFVLYDDDRESYAYERGEFSRQRLEVSARGPDGAFTLTIGAIEGNHTGAVDRRSYRVEVPLSLARPKAIALNGKALDAGRWHQTTDRTVIDLEAGAGPYTLSFR